MEKIIKQIQSLRVAQGLKPLTNPAKLGKAKLEEALAKLKTASPKLTGSSKAIDELVEMSKVKPDHLKANKTIEALIKSEAKSEVDTPNRRSTDPVPDPVPESKAKTKTIKEISCELLCEVEAVSEEGRTIGMSYDAVLARVLEQRPGAKTSLNCLRWYAGKIRVLADGYFQYKLPQLRMRPLGGKHTASEVPAVIITDEA